MNRLRPITARVRARPLDDAAVRREEIAAAAPVETPPFFALPGEWERVTGFSPGSDLAAERRAVAGGRIDQPATTAICLADALIADGTIYAGRGMAKLTGDRTRPMVRGAVTRVDHALVCTTWVSWRYFAHWLIDGLSLEILAAEREWQPWSAPRGPWLHEAAFRQAAGLPRFAPSPVRVGELWMVDDRALNADRARRFGRLRERLRGKGGGPRRVFLDRGSTGEQRALVNRDAVLAALEPLGFVTVTPEALDGAALTDALSSAEVCVGVEGSALANAVALMPAGARILVLEPPTRFTALIKTYADMAGIACGYVVGDPAGEGPSDFAVPVDRLLATLDLLDAI